MSAWLSEALQQGTAVASEAAEAMGTWRGPARRLAEAACGVMVSEAAVLARAQEAVEKRLQRLRAQRGKARGVTKWSSISYIWSSVTGPYIGKRSWT